MDLYRSASVEFRGTEFEFREIPIQTYLEWVDSVGTLAEADPRTVMAQCQRILALTVVGDHDFSQWPLAALRELSKLATEFHTRGGVDDDLGNSSGGPNGRTRFESAANSESNTPTG